jgi:hypothetical protein
MSASARLSLLEQAYERSRAEFERMIDFLKSKDAAAMTESELERAIGKRGLEMMRILMQEHIDGRGPGLCEQDVRGTDGVERSHVRLRKRKIETVFGSVEENRAGYGFPGVDSLHPLDAEFNLPKERYSLELRRRVALEAAASSFDETLETIRGGTGAHIESARSRN